MGRYVVGYTVGNLVLQRRESGAVKRDFRTYIRRYSFPNENFEYGYPHSNALLQFELNLERCKPHKATGHPTNCDVINDVKLFPTVYRRIYCRKFLTLSNQTSRLQTHVHLNVLFIDYIAWRYIIPRYDVIRDKIIFFNSDCLWVNCSTAHKTIIFKSHDFPYFNPYCANHNKSRLLSRLLKCFRSLYGKQSEPRSDCSYRSSLFWVHAVCFYT